MSVSQDGFIHFFAGACGGTVGAVVTCPLEVIKTRLQSSSKQALTSYVRNQNIPKNASFVNNTPGKRQIWTNAFAKSQIVQPSHHTSPASYRTTSLYHCFRHIIRTEGPRALWKGLGPTLIGVAPSRAIYFCTYSQLKKTVVHRAKVHENSPIVHIVSAAGAGFSVCTLTNPIWLVKTRLQLNETKADHKLGTFTCMKQIYKGEGIRGFYKGLVASYYGISETVVHLAIYETLKIKLRERVPNRDDKIGREFVDCMLAAACSRTVASVSCYPHEVARTRIREKGNKYVKFWQTLGLVLREEKWRGLYAGLGTQLLRQIPNTAIMMATYEFIVRILTKDFAKPEFLDYEIED